MAYWIGTSGYSYPEWKGSFYPETLPAARMLPYYAERFSTVEINTTFYRLPTARLVAGWAEQTPPRFRFTLKAPRRITHDARLRGVDELVRVFSEVAATLGVRLGVLLFQLPPSLRKDLPLLDAFLAILPPDRLVALEVRHASWLADEVFAALRARNVALCIADSDRLRTPAVATADFGYFRLRDEGYTPKDLERWAATISGLSARWRDTYVYFKHEEQGTAPTYAASLMRALGIAPAPSS